jgi:hypothetical protein
MRTVIDIPRELVDPVGRFLSGETDEIELEVLPQGVTRVLPAIVLNERVVIVHFDDHSVVSIRVEVS